jgi:hypothetical protein
MRAILILAIAAMAGAAQAQTRLQDVVARFQAEPAPAIVLKGAALPPASAASLSSPDLFFKAAADDAPPARPKGTVQTAIDRSFSPSNSVVGSVGYLCGLQPGANTSGGVASSHEPAGTFLGGQLRVAF